MSPQLNRYVISLFGILQVILRGPPFDPDSSERQVELANGAIIDQLFFTEAVRFTQMPDELCAQWLEEPQTIMDDTGNGLAVRTAVLSCAAEVYPPLRRLIFSIFKGHLPRFGRVIFIQFLESIISGKVF